MASISSRSVSAVGRLSSQVASKQVGCGLLHSADIARKIGIERDARRRMEKSGKTAIDLPGLKVRRMDEQAVKDWEKARNNNPVPLADIENAGENASLAQQQLQCVYEVLTAQSLTETNPSLSVMRSL